LLVAGKWALSLEALPQNEDDEKALAIPMLLELPDAALRRVLATALVQADAILLCTEEMGMTQHTGEFEFCAFPANLRLAIA
jgi:hypothetical protein